MKQSQRIVKNLVAGALATAAGGLLQLAGVVLVARYMSVAAFGAYSLMLSFAFVIQRLGDLGISNILMRDTAVEPGKIAATLGAALYLVWMITTSCATLMFGALTLLHFDRTLEILTGVMGVAGLSQCQIGCYGAVLRSQEDNELHAAGFILHKLVLLGLIFAAVKLSPALTGVVIANLMANLCQWWFYRTIVINRYGHPSMRVNLALWKYLVANSAPLGIAIVVRLLAEQADLLALTWLSGLTALGLFSGPFRLAAGLRFVPQAMVIALFPVYSRAAADASAGFHEIYERGLRGFVVFALPIGVVFLLSPGALVTGLLGMRYAAATPVMRLLGVAVVLLFVTSLYPFLLTAVKRQKFVLVSSTIALVLRAALDLPLTARYSYRGPCYSMIISESILVAMWIARLWRDGYHINLPTLLWRPAIASLSMAAVLMFFMPTTLLTLTPVALLGLLVYAAVLFKLGAFSTVELDMAREGMNFVRPFVADWSRRLERRVS